MSGEARSWFKDTVIAGSNETEYEGHNVNYNEHVYEVKMIVVLQL